MTVKVLKEEPLSRSPTLSKAVLEKLRYSGRFQISENTGVLALLLEHPAYQKCKRKGFRLKAGETRWQLEFTREKAKAGKAATGTPCVLHPLCCTPQILGFRRSKVCGSPASGRYIGTIFPMALAHFVPLCHILVIPAIVQPFIPYSYICCSDQ